MSVTVGKGKDFTGISISDQEASVQYADPRADLHDQFDLVFDDDAGSVRRHAVGDQSGHVLGFRGRHSAGRFVQEDEFRITRKNPRNFQPPQLGQGQGVGQTVPIILQADSFQGPFGFLSN